MKIQVLNIIIILALFVFESFLFAAARYKKNPSRQELRLENARLTAALRKLECKSVPGKISEHETLNDGDLELGMGTGIGRRRSSSVVSEEDKDQIEFNRSLTSAILTQTSTQRTMADVLEQNTRYQDQETRYNRCTRRIAWITTGATFAYATTGFIMTNWHLISAYFGGKSHGGASGAGGNNTTNSTGF